MVQADVTKEMAFKEGGEVGNIGQSWGESVKTGGTSLMPKLEDVHKEAVKMFGEEPFDGRSRAALS